jgi:hypothetical protein
MVGVGVRWERVGKQWGKGEVGSREKDAALAKTHPREKGNANGQERRRRQGAPPHLLALCPVLVHLLCEPDGLAEQKVEPGGDLGGDDRRDERLVVVGILWR